MVVMSLKQCRTPKANGCVGTCWSESLMKGCRKLDSIFCLSPASDQSGLTCGNNGSVEQNKLLAGSLLSHESSVM